MPARQSLRRKKSIKPFTQIESPAIAAIKASATRYFAPLPSGMSSGVAIRIIEAMKTIAPVRVARRALDRF